MITTFENFFYKDGRDIMSMNKDTLIHLILLESGIKEDSDEYFEKGDEINSSSFSANDCKKKLKEILINKEKLFAESIVRKIM